jgi:methionyl-tRNA formyltransferase
MSSNNIVCIAGKNQIAIDGVRSILKAGIQKSQIYCICNKTDTGIDSWQPSFKRFCTLNNLKIVQLEDVYEIESLVFISLEFDQIVSTQKFKSKELFNIHFSALPKYKGMFTSILPILHGEENSGVTLHYINDGIDTGDVIDQITFSLPEYMTGVNLYFEYLKFGKELFEKNIRDIFEKNIKSAPQNISKSSYFSKSYIDFTNLEINLRQTAFQVANFINAFSFRPYQLLSLNGVQIVKSVVTENQSNLKPGTIIIENPLYFDVATIDYNIRVFKDILDDILNKAKLNDKNAIEEFYKLGFDLSDRNEKGWNSLIVASFFESIDVIDFLLENNKVDINCFNYNGTTPLMYAMTTSSKNSNVKVMKRLLDHGANPFQEDFSGKNVFEYAEEYGNREVINFLRKYL